MSTVLRSPNDMLADAKRLMLDGRDPVSEKDWMLIVNCLAFNMLPEIVYPALKLFRVLYDMPLSEADIVAIIDYQQAQRKGCRAWFSHRPHHDDYTP